MSTATSQQGAEGGSAPCCLRRRHPPRLHLPARRRVAPAHRRSPRADLPPDPVAHARFRRPCGRHRHVRGARRRMHDRGWSAVLQVPVERVAGCDRMRSRRPVGSCPTRASPRGPRPTSGSGSPSSRWSFLVLGRHAAGKPEAMALSSAHVPFRFKLTLVWIGIFFVLALFLSQIGLEWGWMRDNFSVIAKGAYLHHRARGRSHHHRGGPGAARSARPAVQESRSRSASPASTHRSSEARR